MGYLGIAGDAGGYVAATHHRGWRRGAPRWNASLQRNVPQRSFDEAMEPTEWNAAMEPESMKDGQR
ncbi:hypothetical protein D9X30_5861 [Cupriavidus sp. U2]|nr:hypothetical protein D9X30_5861 [Cupriavidus sp. U2]